MKIVLNFHDPAKELPKESGTYLCLTKGGNIIETPFSAKFGLFNSYDFEKKADAEKYAMKIVGWTKSIKNYLIGAEEMKDIDVAEQAYKNGYDDGMQAGLNKALTAVPEQPKFTDEQLFALRAVCYGCAANRKLDYAFYINRNMKGGKISFEDALHTVGDMLEEAEKDEH